MAAEEATHTLRADRILSVASNQESVNLGGEIAPFPNTPCPTAATTSNKKHDWLTIFWYRHVSVSVPHVKCRDHLGQCWFTLSPSTAFRINQQKELTNWHTANERTALAWIRTAQAFAMLGVVIAQLMRLTHSTNPNPVFGFFVVSLPLSSMCHIMALLIACVGFYRFMHWQKELVRGNAISSGWELLTVGTLSTLVSQPIHKSICSNKARFWSVCSY